jgi:hypothetical protein
MRAMVQPAQGLLLQPDMRGKNRGPAGQSTGISTGMGVKGNLGTLFHPIDIALYSAADFKNGSHPERGPQKLESFLGNNFGDTNALALPGLRSSFADSKSPRS